MYGVTQSQYDDHRRAASRHAPVLPFEFQAVARTYGRYVDEIEKGRRRKPPPTRST